MYTIYVTEWNKIPAFIFIYSSLCTNIQNINMTIALMHRVRCTVISLAYVQLSCPASPLVNVVRSAYAMLQALVKKYPGVGNAYIIMIIPHCSCLLCRAYKRQTTVTIHIQVFMVPCALVQGKVPSSTEPSDFILVLLESSKTHTNYYYNILTIYIYELIKIH